MVRRQLRFHEKMLRFHFLGKFWQTEYRQPFQIHTFAAHFVPFSTGHPPCKLRGSRVPSGPWEADDDGDDRRYEFEYAKTNTKKRTNKELRENASRYLHAFRSGCNGKKCTVVDERAKQCKNF